MNQHVVSHYYTNQLTNLKFSIIRRRPIDGRQRIEPTGERRVCRDKMPQAEMSGKHTLSTFMDWSRGPLGSFVWAGSPNRTVPVS